jgi:hypothetical protein
MFRRGWPALALCAAIGLAGAAPKPAAPLQLFALARAELAGPAGSLWPGWDQTPFSLLLIEGEQERLVCHPRSVDGFSAPQPEPATGCDVQVRARQFPPGLLAAMPAFGLPATVVVGTPEATRKSGAAWRATLLHEHFHQHQWTLPRYAERVDALGLSGGDLTGMWMLNYAFPYKEAVTVERFRAASAALAVGLKPDADPRRALATYLSARDALAASVPARDWRYAEFQLWQEGVARWTELAAAERSPDPELRQAGKALAESVRRELARSDLAVNGRVAFYALGAGEAMLLERCRSRWKPRYPHVMSTGPLLRAALEDCAGNRR